MSYYYILHAFLYLHFQTIRTTHILLHFQKEVAISYSVILPFQQLHQSSYEFPIDFQLDDSRSMVAGMKLSSFDEVVVTARVTRDGDATIALQNLEAKSDAIRVADNVHLNLTIQ